MKLPNAQSGVKKIYVAEIFTMIATICMGLLSGISEQFAAKIANGGTGDEGTLTLLGGLLLAAGILVLVAAILKLIGVIKASKDESSFKTALIWIVLGIVFSVAMGTLGEEHQFYRYLAVGSRLTNILTTVYIIIGVTNLAAEVGDNDQEARGKRIQNIIIAIYGISFILDTVSDFTKGNIPAPVLAVCGIVALVLMIVYYFMYLKLLSRSRKMLEN